MKIIYEDEDILVADKPSGMPIHPSRMHQGDTLSDAVRDYLGRPDDFVFRAINRLDKDTSGLVLIAKNIEAARKLYADMEAGLIHREYVATVEDDGTLPENGTIDKNIKRLNEDDCHDIRRTVCDRSEGGKHAVTHYSVLKRENGKAVIRCILDTGRTHQIRVHMTHIGHPLVGDELYAQLYGYSIDPEWMPRQALHAERLRFSHPSQNKIVDVSADLPADMVECLKYLHLDF